MEATLLLVAFAWLLPAVLSIVALASMAGLRTRMAAIERRLAALSPSASGGEPVQPPPHPPSAPLRTTPQPQTLSPSPFPPRPPRSAGNDAQAPLHRLATAVRRWFGAGNVPVKVGMLVLFAGVAALLKHASDQGWLRMPIEARLLGVAAAALGALAFAWRQRGQRRQFALAMQGGAVGVLLLVVFAAFRLYGLLSPGLAFGLSIVLVAAAGLLAVVQDAVWLALLGLVAGFLAPLWLASGDGNHVVLFTYYGVLNAGILAIALRRSWRALNVLGFVFTFAIGTAWGVLDYTPGDYATTQPFLLLFFAFYLLVPILQRRNGPLRRDALDGCLVFGVPLVAFALQAGLLDDQPVALAWCAMGLAAVYALLGWVLRRRDRYRALVAPYAALAVGFATLAVPLALSARATGGVFALEGAALTWLGLRQHSRRQQFAGVALQLAAAVAYAGSLDARDPALPLFANGPVMGALLMAVAGLASAWSHRVGGSAMAAGGFLAWGLAWWVGALWREIGRIGGVGATGPGAPDLHAVDFRMVLVLATGWLASEVHRRLPSRALAWTATAALVAALPFAFAQDRAHDFPLAAHGWIGWGLLLVAGWRMLAGLRADAIAPAAHAAWWLGWTLLASLCLHHLAVHLGFGGGWRWLLAGTPWLALAAALQSRPEWLASPFASRFEGWRGELHRWVMVLLAIGWLLALREPGDSAPLPWVAIANPLDLAQLATLALVAAWLRTPGGASPWTPRRVQGLAGAAFGLTTVIVLRGCHHWGGVAWAPSMFDTGLVQAALTVAWSLLGVGGWILGSRCGHRGLWLAGAVLMGVVLAKLLLVDRQHLGNLPGILSFIAYGVMCTVVGYLAPAPPRAPADSPPGSGQAASAV
ncbi:MAG TPA: DUF2339 domain-containing protein [Xanthomonadaceae bacterium]|nr:DUF2339 domain-containing protein [Xanthomonadaceae bacterium]